MIILKCSQKILLVRKRGYVQGATEMQATSSAKVGAAAVDISDSGKSTPTTQDAGT